MNSPLPASGPAQRGNWTRRLVNVLVALVVIAVAAAAFVFSYDGVHAIALLGGVSVQLARYYPGLFDAVLVIACVAAVVLRDGRWWARLWAWVVVIVVLAAIGATDVLHAISFKLPHRLTEAIVAVAPIVGVLLAFSLLLTMLRQSKTADAAAPAGPAPLDVPALPAAVSVLPFALPAAAMAPAAPLPDPVPAREAPVAANAAEVPQAAAPDVAYAITEPNELIPWAAEPAVLEPAASEAPTEAVPTLATAPARDEPAPQAPAQDEPAPPTVQIPALSPGPGAEVSPGRARHGIRYAGNGVPGTTERRQAAEDDAARSADDWDAEEAGQFAGLVYPVREGRGNLSDLSDAVGSDADDVNDTEDTEAGEPAHRKNPPELDDDTPPFATAPFAPVPQLNRVRSTPTPPADEDE
jgi:hypothetical protein